MAPPLTLEARAVETAPPASLEEAQAREDAAEQQKQEDEKIGAEIQRVIDDHTKQFTPFYKEFIEFDRHYRAQGEERKGTDPGKGRANTANLEFFRCVESVASATDSVCFGDDPWYLPWSKEISDDFIQRSQSTKAVMDDQHIEMGLRMKAQDAIRMGLLMGTQIVEEPWVENTVWVDPGDDSPEFVPEVDYDGPNWVNIPIWRFHWDPLGTEIDNCKWVSKETEMDRDDLAEYIEACRKFPGARVRTISEIEALNSANVNNQGKFTSDAIKQSRGQTMTDASNKITVHDYWGLHPTKKDPTDPEGKRRNPMIYHIVCVGNQWVVEMTNPYRHGKKPFFKWTFIKLDEMFLGFGLGHMLSRAQKLLNERKNLMTETAVMALFGMWRRRNAPNSKLGKAVRVYSGRVFDDVTDGEMEPIPVNTSSIKAGMQMDQVDVEAMRAASGASSNTQALPQGGTATEIRTIASESARRIATFAVSFMSELMKPFLMRQAQLNDQFGPEAVTVGVPDVSGVPKAMAVFKTSMIQKPRFLMKTAVDLEFRKPMMRNIQSAIQNYTTLATSAGNLFAPGDPRAMAWLATVLPPIFQMMKKSLLLIGENAEQAMPAKMLQDMLALLTTPTQPQLPPPTDEPPLSPAVQRQEAALAAAGAPA